MGTHCGGLSRFDGQRFTTYKEAAGLTSSCVWALAEDKNNDIWVGTWGGGISRFHDGRFTNYSTPQGLPSNVALSIVAARDGIIVDRNLGRFGATWRTASSVAPPPPTAYQAIASSPFTRTTAVESGLERAPASTALPVDHFEPVQAGPESANLPYDNFREDSSGALYALSLMNGINRIDGNRIINLFQGIAPLGMVESDGQNLWFSGKHGISRIAVNDLQRAEHDRESPSITQHSAATTA